LGLLREGFAAIASGPDAATLARIEAAVMGALAGEGPASAPAPAWQVPAPAATGARPAPWRLAVGGLLGMLVAAAMGALLSILLRHPIVNPWAGAVGLGLVPLLALGLRL